MVEASLMKLPWYECHLDFTDDESTLVQVMVWCRQAANHYLSQCWPRSLPLYGITRPQWVNELNFPVLHWQCLNTSSDYWTAWLPLSITKLVLITRLVTLHILSLNHVPCVMDVFYIDWLTNRVCDIGFGCLGFMEINHLWALWNEIPVIDGRVVWWTISDWCVVVGWCQHGGCWCPGTEKVSGHQQPSCWAQNKCPVELSNSLFSERYGSGSDVYFSNIF